VEPPGWTLADTPLPPQTGRCRASPGGSASHISRRRTWPDGRISFKLSVRLQGGAKRAPHAADWARDRAAAGALDLYRLLDDRYEQAATLARLGDTHAAAGDEKAARSRWHQALDLLDELHHPDGDRLRDKLHRVTARV